MSGFGSARPEGARISGSPHRRDAGRGRATVFALTATIHGEITIKHGRVAQSNFHNYPMLLLSQMPKVETLIVPSGDGWAGVGKPPVAVIAPALCDAMFSATDLRKA